MIFCSSLRRYDVGRGDEGFQCHSQTWYRRIQRSDGRILETIPYPEVFHLRDLQRIRFCAPRFLNIGIDYNGHVELCPCLIDDATPSLIALASNVVVADGTSFLSSRSLAETKYFKPDYQSYIRLLFDYFYNLPSFVPRHRC